MRDVFLTFSVVGFAGAVIFAALALFALGGMGAKWLANWANDPVSGDEGKSDE
jgi:hypothetical protein